MNQVMHEGIHLIMREKKREREKKERFVIILSMIVIVSQRESTFSSSYQYAAMAEWLRRLTRNQMGSPA